MKESKAPKSAPAAPSVHLDVSGGDPSRVGYARVSTADQSLDAQLDALRAARCGRVYFDHGVSGAKAKRPGLDAMRSHLRAGDTVVVTKLDRLGRSVLDLLTTLSEWSGSGVRFVAVDQGIDTSTAAGRMVTAMLAAVAEFERELTRERVSVALAARRARGVVGGRPKAMTAQKLKVSEALLASGSTLAEAAAAVGVGRSTLTAARAASRST